MRNLWLDSAWSGLGLYRAQSSTGMGPY